MMGPDYRPISVLLRGNIGSVTLMSVARCPAPCPAKSRRRRRPVPSRRSSRHQTGTMRPTGRTSYRSRPSRRRRHPHYPQSAQPRRRYRRMVAVVAVVIVTESLLVLVLVLLFVLLFFFVVLLSLFFLVTLSLSPSHRYAHLRPRHSRICHAKRKHGENGPADYHSTQI